MRTIAMSWHTAIARRLFPHDQTFMAKRKLHTAIGVAAVGLVAAALVFGLMLLSQQQR